jgi:hypothetical protein
MAIEDKKGRWIQLAFFDEDSASNAALANTLNDQTTILLNLTEEVRKMALNLDTLTTEVSRLETVNSSAVTLLHTLMNEIALLKDDPAALDALVGRVRIATDALAAAIAAVPGDAPVVAPVEVVEPTPAEVLVAPEVSPIVSEPTPVVVEEPVVVDAPVVDAPIEVVVETPPTE